MCVVLNDSVTTTRGNKQPIHLQQQREGDRQTETDRQRQTDTETDRQTETDTETDRQSQRERERQRQRQRQTETETERDRYRYRDRETQKEIHNLVNVYTTIIIKNFRRMASVTTGYYLQYSLLRRLIQGIEFHVHTRSRA